MSSISVQYGCGFDAPRGWINYDGSPTLGFERIPIVGSLYTKNKMRFPVNVRYGDIRKGLPLKPGSVDRLYASHIIEHLAYGDALKALANSFELLRPGGIFRLIVPDLGERARRYVLALDKNDPKAAAQFLDSTLLGERERPQGIKNMLTAALGGYQHRWMWDEASMDQALRECGFVEIRRCDFGDSGDPEFSLVERRDRFIDGDIRELALECRKPS